MVVTSICPRCWDQSLLMLLLCHFDTTNIHVGIFENIFLNFNPRVSLRRVLVRNSWQTKKRKCENALESRKSHQPNAKVRSTGVGCMTVTAKTWKSYQKYTHNFTVRTVQLQHYTYFISSPFLDSDFRHLDHCSAQKCSKYEIQAGATMMYEAALFPIKFG